jgi:hypothetical protein
MAIGRLSMRYRAPKKLSLALLALPVLALGAVFTQPIAAQNPELQQKIAEVKASAAANKQALAQYTYVETTTISIKGDVKKVTHNQVVTGPDGKPQKTSLDPPPAPPSGGRMKQRIIEKKKDEFMDYADSIKTLIQQYLPPDKDLIQQAASQGNIMMGPAGAPGVINLVISNYVKQGDKMTLVMDKAAGGLQSISIATYLSGPSDAVTVKVQFATLPNGGPRYPATVTINGVSKQMTIVNQNANYRHL